MSFKNIASSVGKAANTGLNFGVGKFKYSGGLGSMIGLGAAGAAIGAGTIATASDGSVNPGVGALAGGAAGFAAVPAAGFAVGAIGTAGVGLAKATPTIARGLAAASPTVAGAGAILGSKAADAVWDVGKRMIDWNEDANSFFEKIKFTGPVTGAKQGWRMAGNLAEAEGAMAKTKTFLGKSGSAVKGAIINGKTLLGVTAMFEGGMKAWNTLQKEHMGQMTGTTTLTPQMNLGKDLSYADDAGATGDLVFALNANRRG